MPDARLEVTDALGRRIVPIAKAPVRDRPPRDQRPAAGRQRGVARSRRDRRPGQPFRAPRPQLALRHLRQRRAGHRAHARARRPHPARPHAAAPRWCSCWPTPPPVEDAATTTAIGDLRQIAALLEGLRALGSGRVLDDVLALVLDSAIEVTGAERGFIMLATPTGELEFKMARGARARRRCPAAASRPAARFPKKCSAPASRGSSPTCSTASSRTCTWAPWRSASATCCACRCGWCATSIEAEAVGEERRIGVLYLDSREKGTLLSNSTRGGARDAGDRSGRRDRERAALSRDDGEGADGAGDADRGRDPAGAAARRPAGRGVVLQAPRRRRCRAARSAATSTTTSICRTARSASRSATSPARGRPRRS